MLSVEKTRVDFHRLAAPARIKSAIQSITYYGSGVVGLGYFAIEVKNDALGLRLYWGAKLCRGEAASGRGL
jgi:hypothetical protein